MAEFLGDRTFPEIIFPIFKSLASIVFIFFIASLAIKLASVGTERILLGNSKLREHTEERRLKTLCAITQNSLRYLVYFITTVMALEQIGIQTSSILAAAGVGGLAIGFGAQNLVRDLVSGFFILLEDHYDIGDHVSLSGVSGIVEELGIRVTKVRDFGGELHIVPNGEIKQVTNHMGSAMRVLVDVDIAYEVDADMAIGVLEKLFAELSTELTDIVEGPKVLGVDALGDSGVKLLTWAKAKSMTQWSVAREIRKRIKKEFDKHDIEIPYPRRYVIQDSDRPEKIKEMQTEERALS